MSEHITVLRIEFPEGTEKGGTAGSKLSTVALSKYSNIGGNYRYGHGFNLAERIQKNPELGNWYNDQLISKRFKIKRTQDYIHETISNPFMRGQTIAQREWLMEASQNRYMIGKYRGAVLNFVNKPVAEIRKTVLKGTTAAASAGLYVASVVSQYKTTGYQLSGASHHAQVEQNKMSALQQLAGYGIGMAVNPALAAIMLAKRAYDFSQETRTYLYDFQKNSILNRLDYNRMTVDTFGRRF